MITVDYGNGRKVNVTVFARYLHEIDGDGVKLTTHFEGKRYEVIARQEPGKSVADAQARGMAALEKAVKAGTPGSVVL